MQLPPKRYQSDGNPKYDSIRHLPWFATLAERREKISSLEQALKWKKETFVVRPDGHREYATLIEASKAFGVDERELRDFIDFQSGRDKLAEVEPIGTRKAYQMILDQAYDVYHDINGRRSFNKIIFEQSPLFGVNARHVIELWETDPGFYPLHYRGIR